MMNWTFTDLVAAKRQRVLTKSRSSDEIVALDARKIGRGQGPA